MGGLGKRYCLQDGVTNGGGKMAYGYKTAADMLHRLHFYSNDTTLLQVLQTALKPLVNTLTRRTIPRVENPLLNTQYVFL